MEIDAEYVGISLDYKSNKTLITFATNNKPSDIEKWLEKAKNKLCTLIFKQKVNKRSLDANALLWSCIADLSKTYTPPKTNWEIYLEMLKKYGQYTFIMIAPDAVEAMQNQWRETEIVGEVVINGIKQVQMICYFGSSTYNRKEFSHLLDGVIAEMLAEGLQPPTDEKKWQALERWATNEKCLK